MTMFRNALLAVAFVVAASAGAQAQDHRVEIAGTAGWTFSDGVSGNPVLVPGVGTFDRLDPKDAFSWGARIGFMVNEHVEVGGLFNLQSTTLEAGGTNTLEIGDQKIYNYHGFIAYNFGDPDAKTRPYFLGGAGATQYGGLTTDRQPRHRRQHAVLDHLGARREDVPGQERRDHARGPLDAHLHQVGLRGLVVRSLLGLLRGRQRASTRTSGSSPEALRSGSSASRQGGAHDGRHPAPFREFRQGALH
jgi:hypothetical protein